MHFKASNSSSTILNDFITNGDQQSQQKPHSVSNSPPLANNICNNLFKSNSSSSNTNSSSSLTSSSSSVMSIASCLGSLGNTANAQQQNQSQNNQQQSNSQSPTGQNIVMNNSSLSNGSNGLDLGGFSFGSLNGTANNSSSISPNDNQLNSIVGSGLNHLNNSSLNSSTFTKCVLCNLQYGSPKVMPCCFRTFCLSCLEKLQQHQQLKCPGCSHEIHLNENGVSGLHTDYSIIRILEQINEINNGINGSLNGSNNNLKELTCSMHSEELLRYYCKTCDQATCKECISFHHQKHENEYLIDASNKFIDQLYSLMNDGKNKSNELNLTLKSIEHNSSKLQVQYSKAQNDIQESYLFYMSQLEQQKNLQLKELEDNYNSKYLTLSLLNSKIHDAIDKMNQMRMFLERYKKFKCNLELIQFKQLIEMRLKQFKNFEPELNIPKVDLEFVYNYQVIQANVKQNFGYIRNSETVKQPPISRPNCGLLNYQHHSFDGSLLSNKNSSNSSNSSNSNSSNNSSCSPAATSNSILNGFSNNGNLNANGSSAINSLAAAMNNLNTNSLNSNSGNLCNNNLLQENIATLYEKWSMGCGSGGSPDSGLFTNSTSISDPLLELSTSKLTSVASNLTNGSNLTSLVSSHQQSQLPVGSVASQIAAVAAQQQLLPIKSQVKRQKMIYHCKFGEFGVMEGQFTEPSGVAVNAQNDVIVADTNNHRIQIFDKEGRFKFQFGECGKKDGQLLYPNRVAVVKQSGDIIVTERSPTHQIQIYNQYGQFVRKFGATILQHPRGVTVDNKGRIIVVECKVMRVLIFDQMGNVLQKFGCSKHLEFPNGVVVNDRQEIFISDNRAHCVKVFSYEGQFLRQIGGEGLTNYPIGVCINESGEILVADNHNNFNITVFTQTGQLLNALESKVKHAQCFDVALMDDNSVVLASKDYRIYVYRYLQLQSLAQAVATSGLC